jgi:predicted amidohydrolase YtcJ
VGRLQAVSGEQALALYTRDAAWLAFCERERGMLRPGLPADLTVLSEDPVACGPRGPARRAGAGHRGGEWVHG